MLWLTSNTEGHHHDMTPEEEFAKWVRDSNAAYRQEQNTRWSSYLKRRNIKGIISMGTAWDVENIPDSSNLPADNYLCEIEECKTKLTAEKQKLSVSVVARVVEPKEYAGMPVFDTITIGTDEVPEPDINHKNPKIAKASKAAWFRNGTRVKQLVGGCGIDAGQDLDDDLKACIGEEIGVTTSVEPRTVQVVNASGQTERRATGEVQSRVRAYFKPGDKPYGEGLEASVNGNVAPKKKAKPVEEEEEPEEKPKAKARPREEEEEERPKAKAKAKPVEEEEEEEEEEAPPPKAKKRARFEEED